MKVGDRLTYVDPHRPDDATSGEITDIFDGPDGQPASCVVKGDDGLWHAINLTLCTIKDGKEALH